MFSSFMWVIEWVMYNCVSDWLYSIFNFHLVLRCILFMCMYVLWCDGMIGCDYGIGMLVWVGGWYVSVGGWCLLYILWIVCLLFVCVCCVYLVGCLLLVFCLLVLFVYYWYFVFCIFCGYYNLLYGLWCNDWVCV